MNNVRELPLPEDDISEALHAFEEYIIDQECPCGNALDTFEHEYWRHEGKAGVYSMVVRYGCSNCGEWANYLRIPIPFKSTRTFPLPDKWQLQTGNVTALEYYQRYSNDDHS